MFYKGAHSSHRVGRWVVPKSVRK